MQTGYPMLLALLVRLLGRFLDAPEKRIRVDLIPVVVADVPDRTVLEYRKPCILLAARQNEANFGAVHHVTHLLHEPAGVFGARKRIARGDPDLCYVVAKRGGCRS